MTMSTPYPTPVEILDRITVVFEIKNSSTAVSDLVSEKVFDPAKFRKLFDKFLDQTLTKAVGEHLAESVRVHLQHFFNSYLQSVATVNADGIPREEMISLLSKYMANHYVAALLQEVHERFGGPCPSQLLDGNSAVRQVIDWLANNDGVWKAEYSSLRKEDKDKISAWKRSENLPSCTSIRAGIGSVNEKALLIVARVIDALYQHSQGKYLLEQTRELYLLPDEVETFNCQVEKAQCELSKKYEFIYPAIRKLSADLDPKAEKQDRSLVRQDIDKLRKTITGDIVLNRTDYFIDWMDARWHVYAGELDKAIKLYKAAHKKSLYRAGLQQKSIIEEALLVAAAKKNPDIVFLKRLRWTQRMLGYESYEFDQKPTNKSNESFHSWEVELWRNQFLKYFPSVGLFKGVEYEILQSGIGPIFDAGLFESNQNKNSRKPDYRNLNRKISVGSGSAKRRMQQLIWYSRAPHPEMTFKGSRDFEVCKKLLKKGADVNVVCNEGRTPILNALEGTDHTAVFEPDDRFFDLFCDYGPTPESINLKTEKEKLLPVMCAIGSGNYEIVNRVLNLGACVNARGTLEGLSPLMYCMRVIGILRNPDNAKRPMMQMPDAMTLDAMRRQSMGLSGSTLEQQREYAIDLLGNARNRSIARNVVNLRVENMVQRLPVSSIREIALLLINNGADVNDAHINFMGQTPLMIAAEFNEGVLFQEMLQHGGEPEKTYYDSGGQCTFDCWQLANHFQSDDVKKVLCKHLRL